MASNLYPAPKPEDIWNQLGPFVRETVLVDGASFLLERPEDSDRLINHPAVRQAFSVDEYLPYWADLWPGARMLAKALKRAEFPPGLEAWEMGCGLGLPGIVALSRGLRVTFTDYDACALRVAAANARLNGFDDFATRLVDWRRPPDDVQVPLLFGADLVYELRNVEPLVSFIRKVLHPKGECLLTDQDRIPAHYLREVLTREGLGFATEVARAGEPNGRRFKGTLYRIHKTAS